jgi:iron complex outermembrane receptor protein
LKARSKERIVRAGLAALLLPLGAWAAPPPSAEDLAGMSLEELGEVEVTTVSRRAERLLDAPASIYVISAEEIRRSGATTLPEVLRLAPNLEVARVGASSFAISARGFNNSTGNKLQVLLDGRVLYTPLFSGVFWDAQDTLIEDIDRVEVISGSLATLWGTNAVNGVINIITRRASETSGGLMSVQAGDVERDYGVRYGAAAGPVAFRVYARAVDRDDAETGAGVGKHDGWRRAQVGFRADSGTPLEGWTVQGDAYRGFFDTPLPRDQGISGANLLGRWNHRLERGGQVRFDAYVDHTQRDIPGSISESLNLYELGFQHDLAALGRHDLTWGFGYRGAQDDVRNAPAIAFVPARKSLHWSNAYLLDTIALDGEALKLTAGLRVSENTYTGVEWMPTLRLAWKPAAPHLLWAAFARAVRTPSRLDRELYIPGQPPFALAGGGDFRSEVSNDLTVGYRGQPSARSQVSVTVYHHEYDSLRSIEQTAPRTFVIGNEMEGRSTGVEAWGSVNVTPRWNLGAGLALLDLDLRLRERSTDPTGTPAAGNDPKSSWFVRSWWDVGAHCSLDLRLRHVGDLPSPRVPAYTALDLQLRWRPRPALELGVSAQNLLDPGHPEFGNVATAAEAERNIQASVRWTF